MSMKPVLFLLSISAGLLLAPALSRAAGTGQAAASISIEIEGKPMAISGATATLMDEGIDLQAIDLIARHKSGYRNGAGNTGPRKTPDPAERNYHIYRYAYLVGDIENSRRSGVRQIRHGLITKRTDGNGRVLFRYVQPGNYFVGAYRRIGQIVAVWCVPVQVGPDRTVEIELNNANAFELYYPGK